jgi:hypothetical protein
VTNLDCHHDRHPINRGRSFLRELSMKGNRWLATALAVALAAASGVTVGPDARSEP